MGASAGSGFIPLEGLAAAEPAGARGLAAAAARAPRVDLRNDVEYHDLPCRSVVTRCSNSRMPFEFTLNPYRGCEFGCTYCYARYTHEYLELEHWLDFERKIFVKQDAVAALRRDLARLDPPGRWIAIGTATDPYQPAERRFGVTRAVLEVLAERRGMRVSITTKSDLVLRDLDLLAAIRERNHLRVNVTINTPRHLLSRRIEPRAPRPDRRLKAVAGIAAAGIPCAVFLMPVMPAINDRRDDLELLIRLAAEAGADVLGAQVLFLRSSARKRFFPFLEERFPELLPLYRRLYGRDPGPLRDYTGRVMPVIRRLRQQYGLNRDEAPRVLPADQLSLEL